MNSNCFSDSLEDPFYWTDLFLIDFVVTNDRNSVPRYSFVGLAIDLSYSEFLPSGCDYPSKVSL